jgi:hypothetical protein
MHVKEKYEGQGRYLSTECKFQINVIAVKTSKNRSRIIWQISLKSEKQGFVSCTVLVREKNIAGSILDPDQ